MAADRGQQPAGVGARKGDCGMHGKIWLSILIGLVCVGTYAGAGDLPEYEPDPNAERAAVPDGYKWDLAPLFPSVEAWEAARQRVLREAPALARFERKLSDPAELRDCLRLYFRLHREASHVAMYANLRQNVARADDAASGRVQQALGAMDELMRRAAFIRRETAALPAGALEAAYGAEPGLAEYRNYLRNLGRRADRILSPDAERALALLGDNLWAEIDLNEIPSPLEDAYNGLVADMAWPVVRDERGREVRLSMAGLSALRRAPERRVPERRVRREAYDAYFGMLRRYQHVLGATLGGQVRLDSAYARARGYDSSLEAYLDRDNVPVAVYDNLVDTVGRNLGLLHRYVELRRKVLRLPEVRVSDLYVPLAAEVEERIPFARARSTLLAALGPLGPEYGAVLAQGLDPASGWLDLYPHRGKQSGAFTFSVYGPHPFVLMNYMNSLDDVSTLAHEYGHALHSHFAMKSRAYPDFRYVSMIAEIASTCNESLLANHLLGGADSRARRAYLLAERLETIRTTIFRQTLFAEFERDIHRMWESGTPLTPALLDETYRGLIARYYGPGFTLGGDDGMEWAGVPHFYYKYYVWSYATGLSSGIAIADRIRAGGRGAADAYLEMLRGGGSAPPLELLKRAGVDLTRPDAIEAAMRIFERTLDEAEGLLVR